MRGGESWSSGVPQPLKAEGRILGSLESSVHIHHTERRLTVTVPVPATSVGGFKS